MKKLIFVAVLALSAFAAHAQDKKISWNIRAGANVSGIENADSQMKLGWKIGAGFDYAFGERFSLRPMLYYSTKGCTYGENTMGFSPDETLRLNYLEIPVYASYHIGLGQEKSLVVNTGPYMAYLLSHTSSPAMEKLDLKRVDMGIGAGLDFHVRRMVVGVEAQYGISNLAKATDGAAMHNINYSLVLGYRF